MVISITFWLLIDDDVGEKRKHCEDEEQGRENGEGVQENNDDDDNR